jgi:serine/threonine protein kinase/Flp pilus assembly protein TadD
MMQQQAELTSRTDRDGLSLPKTERGPHFAFGSGEDSEHLDATTAAQEVQIRNLEDLGSWSDSFQGNAEQVKLFLEIHRSNPQAALRMAEAVTAMPEPGTEFLGFRLIQELGKGAFARVYLAQQGDLANRYVALKVTPTFDDESRTLAQLQHTNVVPIYSIHRASPLQAVCMPFFGMTTLAHVLKDIKGRESLPESGKCLVSTLVNRRSTVTKRQGDKETRRQGEQEPSVSLSPCPPVSLSSSEVGSKSILERLQSLSYVEAVLWIASRLADGLAHAHERGIMHRDLKPANILLTDEGQPMLLDFNLAQDTKRVGQSPVALLGGTLPFMAPEQLEAYRQETIARNHNSDLYSLGVILYELLTGRHPFPVRSGALKEVLAAMIEDRRQPAPTVRPWNKAASPAVESIIRHCLEANPARRYQTARELQEDLERQLKHQPLKYAPDPSLAERSRKWARRHPRLASSTSVAFIAGVLILGLTSLFAARGQRLAQLEAGDSLRRLQEEIKTVQFLLTAQTGDPQKLDQGIHLGQSALDRYHVLDNESWQETPLVRHLSASEQERLRQDIGEVLFLMAGAKSLQASTCQDRIRQAEDLDLALRLNELSETCYPEEKVSRACQLQKSRLVALLGQQTEAKRLQDNAAKIEQLTAMDYYLIGAEQVAQGRAGEALKDFQEVTRQKPGNFWAWFMRGVCHDNLAQYADSISSYSTCIALGPQFHYAYYNRGLAELRLQRYPDARADFDQALALNPDLPEVLVNRAMALEGLGKYAQGIEDLTAALKLGASPTQVYFLRSQFREKAGDKDGSKKDLQECLQSEPKNELGWLTRGYAKVTTDLQGALADFNKALNLNPRSLTGLQNKAHVLGRLGQNEEAVRVLDRAVELYPDFVYSRSGRGVYLARLGRREAALKDAEASLDKDRQPLTIYQVAGIYALTSKTNAEDRREAMRLLSSALLKDFGLLDLLETDKDLDPIRKDAEFAKLVDRARALRSTVQENSKER